MGIVYDNVRVLSPNMHLFSYYLHTSIHCIHYTPGVVGASVYTWGSNSNVTLGHDHSRNHPERLDLSGTYSIAHVRFFFLFFVIE